MKNGIWIGLIFIMSIIKKTNAQAMTEDAICIKKKSFQMEGSTILEYYRNNEDMELGLIFPSILLRYGINDNIELRFASSYENKKHVHRLTDGKLSDLELGVKVHLINLENTNLSLINHFLFPSNIKRLNKDNVNANSILVFTQSITTSIQLGTSFQYIFENTEKRDFNYSVILNFGTDKKFNYYIESYGELLSKDLISNLDIGIEYNIIPKMIWQLSYGTSLQKIYHFVSTGFVWQIN